MTTTVPDTLPATTAPATNQTLTPIPQQFSREQQVEFIETLSLWGNVSAAVRAGGVSRATAYRMRRACPDFARLWDAALLLARPQVEAVLADRALNGVEETVFYHGEEVATRRRFDARLLLAHLGRLDRLGDNRGVREAAQIFDDALEALLGEDEIEMVELEKPGRLQGEDADQEGRDFSA